MFKRACRRKIVILPLLLNMNQSPLPSTERKMLNTGKSQPIILWIFCLQLHIIPFANMQLDSSARERRPEIVKYRFNGNLRPEQETRNLQCAINHFIYANSVWNGFTVHPNLIITKATGNIHSIALMDINAIKQPP